MVSYPATESLESEHAYATVHNLNVNYASYEEPQRNGAAAGSRRFMMKRIDMV